MEERSEQEFKKEVIRLEDGRQLIYYTFDSETARPSTEITPSSQEKGDENV